MGAKTPEGKKEEKQQQRTLLNFFDKFTIFFFSWTFTEITQNTTTPVPESNWSYLIKVLSSGKMSTAKQIRKFLRLIQMRTWGIQMLVFSLVQVCKFYLPDSSIHRDRADHQGHMCCWGQGCPCLTHSSNQQRSHQQCDLQCSICL